MYLLRTISIIVLTGFLVGKVDGLIKEINLKKNIATEKEFKNQLSKWLKNNIITNYQKRNAATLPKNLSQQIEFLNKFCDFLSETYDEVNTIELLNESLKYSKIKITDMEKVQFSPNDKTDLLFTAATALLFTKIVGRYRDTALNNITPVFEYLFEHLNKQEKFKPFVMCVYDIGAKVIRQTNFYASNSPLKKALKLKLEGLKSIYYQDAKLGERFAFYLYKKACRFNKLEENKKLVRGLKAEAMNYSPWVVAMITGVYYKNFVWQKRWKIEKETRDNYLKKAKEAFTKALELRKQFPEGPTHMIFFSYLNRESDRSKIDKWMNRVFEIETDNCPAISDYLISLIPERGGSMSELMDFAWAAYNTKRFDTNLPRSLPTALVLCARIIDKPLLWRSAWREPKVINAINEIYSKMLANKETKGLRREILTFEYAYACLWMGEYEKAAQLRKNISDYVMYDSTMNTLENRFFLGMFFTINRSGKTFEQEVAVFTGKDKKLAKEWLDAYLNGDLLTEYELEDKLTNPEIVDKSTALFFSEKLMEIKYFKNYGDIINSYDTLLNLIWDKHNDAAMELVEKGAPLKDNTLFKVTPLALAAKKGNIELVRFFLKKGADVNTVNCDGDRPLHRLFKSKAKQKTVNEILKLILAKKPELNVLNSDHDTPLDLALGKNNKEAVKMLLANGANVNFYKHWGPIHMAANFCGSEMIDLLVKHGADVNAKVDGNGLSAGNIALRFGRKKIQVFQALLKHGFDINQQDEKGNTILHNAVKLKDEEVVKFLLKAGADRNIKNNQGKIPIELTDTEYFKNLFK